MRMTAQRKLRALCEARPQLRVLALHDDVTLQTRPEDAGASYADFRDRMRPLGLKLRDDKGKVYSKDAQAAATAAAATGLPAHTDGVVVGGSPVGTAAFV